MNFSQIIKSSAHDLKDKMIKHLLSYWMKPKLDQLHANNSAAQRTITPNNKETHNILYGYSKAIEDIERWLYGED